MRTGASLDTPRKIALHPNGSLYIADDDNERVREVTPQGIIETVAGSDQGIYLPERALALDIILEDVVSVAFDKQGNLYIGSISSNIYKSKPALPGYSISDILIANRDATQLYHFDNSNRHIKTLDPITGAAHTTLGYDDHNRLIRLDDIDGDTTVIERNTEGDAIALIAPDGQRTELSVNANGHLQTVTNPAGETYRMTYTDDGLMTTFRDRKNQLNQYDYNDLGYLIRDINAGGGGWILERTELNDGYETQMTTAEGRRYRFTVEPFANRSRRQVNTHADDSLQEKYFKPDGEKTITEADGTQIILQEKPDPRFNMQAPLQDFTVITPGGLISTTKHERTVILENSDDPLSLTSLTETLTLNGKVFNRHYTAIDKTYIDTTAAGRTHTTQINNQGRPERIEITGLEAWHYNYDSRGRLTTLSTGSGNQQRLTQLDYYQDGAQQGYLQSITDAENRSVNFEYDLAGRVTKQTLPDNRVIQYAYDANDNLTSITPSGRPAHVFNYNAFDQEQHYTPPPVAGVSNPQTTYDYNQDKELTKITRPDGQEINFNYNTKAQLTSMAIPSGTYTYGYHNTTGQLTNITAPQGGTLTLSYDGFLSTGMVWAGDVLGTVTQSYHNDFQIKQRCVNTNSCIDFSYDQDQLLAQAGSLTINRATQQAGLITGTTLGNASTTRTHNNFGELVEFNANYATTDLYQTTYTRDKLGRITGKTETIEGSTETESYDYDLAGRLISVTRNNQTTIYTYDSNGNRLSKQQGTQTETGTYDNQDRLTNYAGCDYAYTDNGELTAKTCNGETTQYHYDALGNLISTTLPDNTQIEYIIDGQNRRIGKKVNGALQQGFLYQDQLNPIAELDSNNNIVARFVYGTKVNVPDYMIKNNITYRIISDHLGSPRLLINVNTGNIVQRLDYDAFGRIINDTNPGFQPFGFAGGLYDQHTKLTRFGVRDYDAQVGRWTSKDPIKFDGGANLYEYVLNNPVRFIDLDGLRNVRPPFRPPRQGFREQFRPNNPFRNTSSAEIAREMARIKGREGLLERLKQMLENLPDARVMDPGLKELREKLEESIQILEEGGTLPVLSGICPVR